MKFQSLFVVLHAVVARGAGFFAVDFVGISSDFGFQCVSGNIGQVMTQLHQCPSNVHGVFANTVCALCHHARQALMDWSCFEINPSGSKGIC